jgi:hypothetical protein
MELMEAVEEWFRQQFVFEETNECGLSESGVLEEERWPMY